MSPTIASATSCTSAIFMQRLPSTPQSLASSDIMPMRYMWSAFVWQTTTGGGGGGGGVALGQLCCAWRAAHSSPAMLSGCCTLHLTQPVRLVVCSMGGTATHARCRQRRRCLHGGGSAQSPSPTLRFVSSMRKSMAAAGLGMLLLVLDAMALVHHCLLLTADVGSSRPKANIHSSRSLRSQTGTNLIAAGDTIKFYRCSIAKRP